MSVLEIKACRRVSLGDTALQKGNEREKGWGKNEKGRNKLPGPLGESFGKLEITTLVQLKYWL